MTTMPQESSASDPAVADPAVPAPAPHAAEPAPAYIERTRRPGRGLAGAIATFLGGYLVLASLSSQLSSVVMGLFRPESGPMFDGTVAVFLVLQFVFALLVVAVGILLGSRHLGLGFAGAAIAVVASIVILFVQAARLSGVLRIPGDQAVIQSIFGNPWWAVVLWVGVGWLLARRARLGWLALIAVVVLIPIPTMIVLANLPSGLVLIAMYTLSALVGAAIIAGGRPLRD